MPVHDTVFISYRRTNAFLARAVYEHLVQHGYDVFLDFESIDAGRFTDVTLEQVRARAHFVLVLTPSALARCLEPDDWLRREIAEAITHRRNVVPLMFEEFRFEAVRSFLTGPLAALPDYNGIRMHADYFSEAMERLRTRFLDVPVDVAVHAAPASEREPAAAAPTASQLRAEEAFEQGTQLYLEGEIDRAQEQFAVALQLHPDFAEALFRRGAIYTTKLLPERARADLERALSLSDDPARQALIRAWLHRVAGEHDAALQAAMEAQRRRPHDPEPHMLQAAVLDLMQRPEDAERAYAEALRLAPGSLLLCLGYAYHLGRRQLYARAEAVLSDAVREQPASFPLRVARGQARMSQQNLEAAREDFDEAVRLNADHPMGYFGRGLVSLNGGRYDDAVVNFDRALQINAFEPETRYYRAVAHAERGAYDDAATDLDAVLKLKPDHNAALVLRKMLPVHRGVRWFQKRFKGS